MGLVRTYEFKEGKVENYSFQIIALPEDLYDLTEDTKGIVPVIRLVDLIKHLDYKISDKDIWDMIDKEETAPEYMFLLKQTTNQAYHISTSGKLRNIESIVLDDEGIYFFLENLRCEKSKNILLEDASACTGMGITIDIHGQEYAF